MDPRDRPPAAPSPSILLLADGRFPSGGHAHSAGAESAMRHGDVVDAGSLERFLRGRLAAGGRTDAAFAARACAAALDRPGVGHGGFPDLLDLLDHEFDARTASPRLRAVSRQMGRQLRRSAAAVWPHPALDVAASSAQGVHQAVVLGLATAAAGGGPVDAAALALHHTSAAIATAAVRTLGLDPVEAAACQARAALDHAATSDDVDAWTRADPVDLPARTSTATEILGEDHGGWERRLFVA